MIPTVLPTWGAKSWATYSKRIMNQVMCLADYSIIKINYQDTDSMHIEAHKVEKLNHLYKCKYNKELIGEELGQFHNDFDPDEWKGKGYKDVVSVGLIAIGKKMYIDKLRGVDLSPFSGNNPPL